MSEEGADDSEFMRSTGLIIEMVTGTVVRGHLQLGERHHTPWGIVHGGVYAAAVETACSTGGSHAVAEQGMIAVGLTNTTQFLRSVRGGRLELEAVAIHQGRTQQFWQAEIRDQDGRIIASGELRLQNLEPPG